MKDQIIEILSEKLDGKLTTEFIDSYTILKESFLFEDYEGVLSKAGKFVENVFRILHYIQKAVVLEEIEPGQIKKIVDNLLQSKKADFPESVRILIPQIANAVIYSSRSKLGAVHIKSITPDLIDAKLTLGAADWIVAELLRIYHGRDTEKVGKMISQIVRDPVPILQKIGTEKFVTQKVECREEILIHLFDAEEGLTRNEIGVALKNIWKPPKITTEIKKMIGNKEIFKTNDDKYHISIPSKNWVKEHLIK